MQASRSLNVRAHRGFTLIELMVVIVIISALLAIGFTVANQVTKGGKTRATQGLLKTLDQAITEYQTGTQGRVPSVYKDATGREFPAIDARFNSEADFSKPALPSQAIIMAVMSKVANVDGLLKNIDPAFLTREYVSMPVVGEAAEALSTDPTIKDLAVGSVSAAVGTTERYVTVPVVKDAFGRPIRFVHPRYHGGFGDFYTSTGSGWTAQTGSRGPLQMTLKLNSTTNAPLREFRRSAVPFDPTAATTQETWVGDADEGLAVGGQPYFYSVGPDGDPGQRDDNVYNVKPNFPAESTTTGSNL